MRRSASLSPTASRLDSLGMAMASLAVILALSIFGAGVVTGLMLAGQQPCIARAWP